MATTPSSSRATASTALTNSAAAHSASRRSAIGTVPAWPASPVNATRARLCPAIAVTTPSGTPLGLEHRTLLDVDLVVADQIGRIAAGAGQSLGVAAKGAHRVGQRHAV